MEKENEIITENKNEKKNNIKKALGRSAAILSAVAVGGAGYFYKTLESNDLVKKTVDVIDEVPEEMPKGDKETQEIIDTVKPSDLKEEGQEETKEEVIPESSETDIVNTTMTDEQIIEDRTLVIPVLDINQYNGNSIGKALSVAGYPSDFAYRKALAEYFANENSELYSSLIPYKGLDSQNVFLLEILRNRQIEIEQDEEAEEKSNEVNSDHESSNTSSSSSSNSSSSSSSNKPSTPPTKPAEPEKPEDKEEWGPWEAIDDEYEQRVSTSGKIEKRKHAYARWVSISDTQEKRICNACGHVEYGEHDYGKWENISDTEKQKECKRCGHKVTQEIDHKHNLTVWAYLNASLEQRSCDEDGCNYTETRKHGVLKFVQNIFRSNGDGTHKKNEQNKCTTCDHLFETLVDEKESCRYNSWTEDADQCLEKHDCKDCGYQETREKHKNTKWVSKDDEIEQLVCLDCDKVLEERKHGYNNPVTEYISNGDGKTHQVYVTKTCPTCDHEKEVSNEEAECTPGEWIYRDGQEYSNCQHCGQELVRVHEHDKVPADLKYTTVTVPGATAHKRAEHYQIGSYTCSCGEVITVTKPSEACTYGEPYVENGYEYEVDPLCGHVHMYAHIDKFGAWVKVDSEHCEQSCLVTGCTNTNTERHNYGNVIDGVEICQNCKYEHVLEETPEEVIFPELIEIDDPRYESYCYEEIHMVGGVEKERIAIAHDFGEPTPVFVFDMLMGLEYKCQHDNGCKRQVQFYFANGYDAIHEFENKHGLPETDVDAFIATHTPEVTVEEVIEVEEDVVVEEEETIIKESDAEETSETTTIIKVDGIIKEEDVYMEESEEEWTFGDDPEKNKVIKDEKDSTIESSAAPEESAEVVVDTQEEVEKVVEKVVEEKQEVIEEEELDEYGQKMAEYHKLREQEIKEMEAQYAELLKFLDDQKTQETNATGPVLSLQS